MLYEYLQENYRAAEPIFFSDIEIDGVTRSAVNQQLKKLCEEKKLGKYENGVYYLPKKTRLKSASCVSADMVARYKYISRKGKVDGFYAGNTFANQLGISSQVPAKPEIVSNHMAAKVREVMIGNRAYIIRKPVVPVTNENVYVLQLLDLLKNLDMYLDDSYDTARERISLYVSLHNITRVDVDLYIRKFPVNVFRYYYELRLNDVLA